MCGNEPCRHERDYTIAQAMKSYVAASELAGDAAIERDKALATLARVRVLADEWSAMCAANEWPDDLPTAVWADAGRAIRAALEPTPKGKP